MGALHLAASIGLSRMVRLLLSAGMNVDAVDPTGRTALHWAVSSGHIGVVRILIAQRAKINVPDVQGKTPLCEAVWHRSIPLTTILLNAGAKMTHSHCLFYYAVVCQNIDLARQLLAAGANPNIRSRSGDTPLIIAAEAQNVEMAKLLLENGAQPDYIHSLTGATPLHELVTKNYKEDFNPSIEAFVRVLIKHGVNMNFCSPLIGTALTTALFMGKYKLAEFLIKVGADVNKMPNDTLVRFTNLEIALKKEHFPLVKLMVAAGHDIGEEIPDLPWPKDRKHLNVDTPMGWLLTTKFNPRSLQDICRINIRKDLGIRVSDVVPKLELPKTLKSFLMLEGICHNKNQPGTSFS